MLLLVASTGCPAGVSLAPLPVTTTDCAPEQIDLLGRCVSWPGAARAYACLPGTRVRTSESADSHRRLWCETPNGVKHGREMAWRPSGRTKRAAHFDGGLKDGQELTWHANGRLASRAWFRRGQTVGLTTWWHDNGQKRFEGRSPDGVEHGRWLWTDRTGAVEKAICYDRGAVIWDSFGPREAAHRPCRTE